MLKKIDRLFPSGFTIASAVLKSKAADFQVYEVSKHNPLGKGEHLWFWIRKINANTDWVAGQLAKQAGLKRRDVSYAGRKDRMAVTEQWFSLYDPKKQVDKLSFSIADAKILQKVRHQQKLRTGQLTGNNFRIVLRDVRGDKKQIDKQLELIKSSGFPNYFGQQRFGHESQNLQAAYDWVKQGGKRINRNKQSIYLSVLRSYLFNAVLCERVRSKSWNQLMPGELAKLSNSNSIFLVEEIEVEQTRCDDFDLDPTGPLPGKAKMFASMQAYAVENSVLDQYPDILQFLKQRMNSERRRLRVVPRDMAWDWQEDVLTLSFFLSKGSYATVLLEQIFDLR